MREVNEEVSNYYRKNMYKWNVCNKPESEELATEERDKMNLQTHC